MLRGLIISLSLLMTACSSQCIAGTDTTVAITTTFQSGSKQQKLLMHSLLDLLEVEVSKTSGYSVVERRHIDLALHELALSKNLGRNSDAQLQLGKIATADRIVTLELKNQTDESLQIIVRIVNSLTSGIQSVSLIPLEDLRVDEAATQIARQLTSSETESKLTLITVAVAPFECKGRFDRLRPLERGLRDMVVRRLLQWNRDSHGTQLTAEKEAATRQLQVLQRSSMEQLLRELTLIQSGLTDRTRLPISLPTRAGSYLFQGDIDEQNDGSEFRVVVTGQLIHAESNMVTQRFEFESIPGELEKTLAAHVDSFAHRLLTESNDANSGFERQREVNEVATLFDNTLRDLRRFRRRRPFDFSYRDFALKGKSSGPPIVQADTILGRAILKKSVDRLETIRFVEPKNLRAAYALGYCLSFQIDGVSQPKRADQLLRQVGAAANDPKLRGEALKLLAEISFHHQKGRVAPAFRQVATSQIIHAMVNTPKTQRDYLWARITELLEDTLPDIRDKQTVERLLQFSKLQASITTSPHRGRFATLAANATEILNRIRPEVRSDSTFAMEKLMDGDDLIMKETAARKLGARARQEKDYIRAASIYQQAAQALSASGTKANRIKSNNLNFHAATCLRLAGNHRQARTLLESFEPVNPRSLNAGYRAVEVGHCYLLEGEDEKALTLLVDAAEQCANLVDNSEVGKLIQRLGGVPLRKDREIDIEYISGPDESPVLAQVLATDGSHLFVAGGYRGGIPRGIMTLHSETKTWTPLTTEFGRVTDMTINGDTLWVATAQDGLWKTDLNSSNWTSFSTKHGLPDNSTSCLVANTNMTFAGVGKRGAGGVVRIDKGGVVDVMDGKNAPDSVPLSMALDSIRLVVTTQTATHELNFDTGRWQIFKAGPRRFTKVFNGKDCIWAARYRKVFMPYDSKKRSATQFTVSWSSGHNKSRSSVDYVVEHAGRIWVGGTPQKRFLSAGFYRIDPDARDFHMFNLRDGFRPSVTYSTFDGVAINNNLWLATSAGLAKVTPRIAEAESGE